MRVIKVLNLGQKLSPCVTKSTGTSKIFINKHIYSIPKARIFSSTNDDLQDLKTCIPTVKKDYSVKNEEDAGITIFFGDHKGFGGILRQLYSDFVVNEIGKDNSLITLSRLDMCPKVINSFNNLKELLSEDDVEKITRFSDSYTVGEIEIYVSKLTDYQIQELSATLQKYIFNLMCYVKNTRFAKVMVLVTSRKNVFVERNYTHFVLYKENIATTEAISYIAKSLKIKSNFFQPAGIKDKRSISSQMISVKNVRCDHLLKLNNSLRGIRVGNVCYANKPLKVGELGGNQFVIIVRELHESEEQIESAIKSVNEFGFINYFGLQRFGKTEVPTLVIGRHILARDWEAAVESIIKPDSNKVSADVLKCRQIWWDSRNARVALKHLHYKGTRLGLLLKGLISEDNDFEKALQWLPTATTNFYMHSYCSYVWNRVVSHKIMEFGRNPVVGDLLMHKHEGNETRFTHEVYEVTQEMIDNGNVSIYDVVLPLPGNEITLPQNEVRTMYNEVLNEDGLNMESFNYINSRFSMRGNYRRIMAKPQRMIWSFLNYDDPSLPLIQSDFEKLASLPANTKTCGNKRALKLKFTLSASVYATSLLREITKRCITEMEKSDDHTT